MPAYYNEIDPFAVEWLRNLISAGLIAPGDVDGRDVRDVRPDDLRGYAQCHFFAGIGVWSYALRRAGWSDDRPVWTGSCPCQPFSITGRKDGFADERHLWPHWHYLIEQCRPAVILGEQVASTDGLTWLDLVQADLEGADYAAAAVDLCAAGVGAPHIRQRLFVGAYDLRCDHPVAVVDDIGAGLEGHPGHGDGASGRAVPAGPVAAASGACDAPQPGPTNNFWRYADWLCCRDGKWRPVEPGTFPMADGTANRVGRLRAYGNAVVAPLAETFVRAFEDATRDVGELRNV